MDFTRLLSVTDPSEVERYLTLADKFAGREGNTALAEVIMRFAESQAVVKKAFFVLLKLFVSGHGVDPEALAAAKAMEAVTVAMSMHAQSAKVQERGLRIFAYAAESSADLCAELLGCGSLEHICSALFMFQSNLRVCTHGLDAISKVLSRKQLAGSRPPHVAGLINSVAVTLARHPDVLDVQVAGFSALYHVVGIVHAYADTLMEMGLGRSAFDAMKRFSTEPALVHTAVVFVSRLSLGSTASTQFPKWCDISALLQAARASEDFRGDALVTLAAAATLVPSTERLHAEEIARTVFSVMGNSGAAKEALKAASILTGSVRYARRVGRCDEWLRALTQAVRGVSDPEALRSWAASMCNIACNDYAAQAAMLRLHATHAIAQATKMFPTADARALAFSALGNACGDCVESRALAATTCDTVEAICTAFEPPVSQEACESAARALEIIFASDDLRATHCSTELVEKVGAVLQVCPASLVIRNSYAALRRECDARVGCAVQTGVCTSALVRGCPSCPAGEGCYCPVCCVPQYTFFCVTCYENTGNVVRLCQSCAAHHEGGDRHVMIKSFMSRRCTCDLNECKVQKKKPKLWI